MSPICRHVPPKYNLHNNLHCSKYVTFLKEENINICIIKFSWICFIKHYLNKISLGCNGCCQRWSGTGPVSFNCGSQCGCGTTSCVASLTCCCCVDYADCNSIFERGMIMTRGGGGSCQWRTVTFFEGVQKMKKIKCKSHKKHMVIRHWFVLWQFLWSSRHCYKRKFALCLSIWQLKKFRLKSPNIINRDLSNGFIEFFLLNN